MKNIGKLAVLGAVLAASASFAFADTLAASYGQANAPYSPSGLITTGNTAMQYGGDITFTSVAAMEAAWPFPTVPTTGFTGPTNEAWNLNPGSGVTPPWTAPISGSAYVGYLASAGPVDHPADVPYGFYKFTTTFTAAVSGNLNVFADDTTAVFLNGVQIMQLGALGSDGHCADNQPNCLLNDVLTGFNANVNDVLTFIVQNAGQTGQAPPLGDPSGVDFAVTSVAAPEPSSLMLLGTGLVSAAGMMFRRRRVTA